MVRVGGGGGGGNRSWSSCFGPFSFSFSFFLFFSFFVPTTFFFPLQLSFSLSPSLSLPLPPLPPPPLPPPLVNWASGLVTLYFVASWVFLSFFSSSFQPSLSISIHTHTLTRISLGSSLSLPPVPLILPFLPQFPKSHHSYVQFLFLFFFFSPKLRSPPVIPQSLLVFFSSTAYNLRSLPPASSNNNGVLPHCSSVGRLSQK